MAQSLEVPKNIPEYMIHYYCGGATGYYCWGTVGPCYQCLSEAWDTYICFGCHGNNDNHRSGYCSRCNAAYEQWYMEDTKKREALTSEATIQKQNYLEGRHVYVQ